MLSEAYDRGMRLISENGIGQALNAARTRKGLSKAELGRRLGISGAAISQWEAGGPGPSIPKFLQAALILEIDTQDEPFSKFVRDKLTSADEADPEVTKLFQSLGAATVYRDVAEPLRKKLEAMATPTPYFGKDTVKPAAGAPGFAEIQGFARDIPVLGRAIAGEEGNGDVSLNGTEIDRAIRPPGLAGAKGIFALYTSNDSMYPAWKENSLFYVNPNRRPSIGDDVVVEVISKEAGIPGSAFLKRLKKRGAGKVVVEQFNPPMEIEFDSDAVRLYRVIPWEEALGLS